MPTSSESSSTSKPAGGKGRKNKTEVQRITSVSKADKGGSGLFYSGIFLVLLLGIGGIGFFAVNRESNVNVAPLPNINDNGDHWHEAFMIHDCGVNLPASQPFDVQGAIAGGSVEGLHSHGDGLLHLHPGGTNASGKNATLGNYVKFGGGELTDVSYTPLTFDSGQRTLSEEEGCNGEPAELKLAIWTPDQISNAAGTPITEEPSEVITEGLAEHRFRVSGGALTLALVAEGEEIPPPPLAVIDQLRTTDSGNRAAAPSTSDLLIPESELDGSDTDTPADEGDTEGEAPSEDSETPTEGDTPDEDGETPSDEGAE